MKKIIVILSILLCLSEKRVEAMDFADEHPYAVWGTVATMGTVVLGYCAWKVKSWCQSPVVVSSSGTQQPTEKTPLMTGRIHFLDGSSGTPKTPPPVTPPNQRVAAPSSLITTGTRTTTRVTTTTHEDFVVLDMSTPYGSNDTGNLLTTPVKEIDKKQAKDSVLASPATRAMIVTIEEGRFNIPDIVKKLTTNSSERSRIQKQYDDLTSDIEKLIAMAEKVKAETAEMRDRMLSSSESEKKQKERGDDLEQQLAEKKAALQKLVDSFQSK